MLNAYARIDGNAAERLESIEAVRTAWKKEPPALWIDLEAPTEDEVREVADLFSLSPEAIEDCLYGEQRPRIDEFDDHIFLVFYGAPENADDPEADLRKLGAFCGSRYLITVHRQALPTITATRQRWERQQGQSVKREVDFLLYTIIDSMVDRYTQVVESYEERLDDLEDVSLAPDVDESILSDLFDLRRGLIELRRTAASQRDLLLPVTRGEYDFISFGLEARFGHVADHLTKVVEVIDGLRDLLAGIRDNYHSAIAVRMNDIMKTLTVFATIMLPLSLIAGIYGMNVPLWPNPGNDNSFWWVIGTMVAIAGALLVYFRRRRWI
jgi:magnesium transporter